LQNVRKSLTQDDFVASLEESSKVLFNVNGNSMEVLDATAAQTPCDNMLPSSFGQESTIMAESINDATS
jgi:hypothetical protein